MMKNYCVSKYICFLLAFSLVSAFIIPASFSAGKFTIQPSIELRTRMDSNFEKHETTTKSVNTYAINPGIILKYSSGKSRASLDYNTTLSWEDGDSNDYHDAALFFQNQTTDLLQISVGNNLTKTRDPASAEADATSIERYRYYLNTFSPQMNYKLSERFNLNLKYINEITDYIDEDDGEGEDALENRIGLTIFYEMNPKTTLDMDYQYWQMDYGKTSADYTSHQIMSNVNYKFNQFALTAGAGYHSRKFDQSTLEDFGRPIWKMDFSGQTPSKKDSIPKSSIYVSLNQNYNDAGQGDSYFTTTGLNASFSYLFTNKINGKLSGYIKNAEYETSGREDDRWSITPAVDYLVNDNFTVGLETGYEERDSNTDGESFDNEYGMIKVKYVHDAWSR